MAGTFELCKDVAGKFRFPLKAGNGQIIATGVGEHEGGGVGLSSRTVIG